MPIFGAIRTDALELRLQASRAVRVAAGDCVGEMALLDLFPRSASVRALEDCVAIELTPADLLRLFERDSEQLALVQMKNIARAMCRRLRVTDEMLFEAAMGADEPPPDTNFQTL